MARIKLTKSAVDAARPQAQAVELRDTVVPGFLCKITPAGRKVFMLQYRTNAGERRKPALGQYGELTVEQARVMAQEWLAEVRRGGDPSAAKNAARKAPTMKEYCHTFMEDYSKQRNKPSTQRGYQGVIDRCSEICPLEWDWVDLEKRRVVWPDSKTGGISKPMSEEAYRLLSTAPRREGCPYVLPSPNDPARHLTHGEHYGGWKRVLKAAGVPHVGTHGIRHRATTDIANSGVPTKVGMKLTGHKTVAMFMHYVHTEDKPVRDAAELVANRRLAITGASRSMEVTA